MKIKSPRFPESFRSDSVLMKIQHYIIAVLSITATALICVPVAKVQGYYVVSFILLIVVSILATFLRTGPVLLASLSGMLVWNFFFIPPHYTFHIDKTEDVLMFSMFGLVVLMNGVFTTRVRRQEKMTREREARTNALFQLTRELSRTAGLEDVLKVAVREIRTHFNLPAAFILIDENGDLAPAEITNPAVKLTRKDLDAVHLAYSTLGQTSRSYIESGTPGCFIYPMAGTLIHPGVIVLEQPAPFKEELREFWQAFLSQISNALEREFLAELARKAKFLDESDRFYRTLFNSVSHELRIPVATILGASDALHENCDPGSMQEALSLEISTASVRLNRLIENLLNMSRLESGRIAARLDWYDINDLINKVLHELREELKAFDLRVSIPDQMPLVRIDYGLMEQVLYNLLLNACQYAPAASEISIVAGYENDQMMMKISDRGPGFPKNVTDEVFDKFYRAGDKGTGGLGLGLSIVRGFVEAHNGRVVAGNRPGGGAEVTVIIPSEIPQMDDISTENQDAG